MDAFRIFDTDKNRKISVEELQKVLVSLGCQKCRLKEYRKMIKRVDRKGDGAVDFEDRTPPQPLNTPKSALSTTHMQKQGIMGGFEQLGAVKASKDAINF
ncbi:hypothetical protein ACFX2I_014647 [Malus domestica]